MEKKSKIVFLLLTAVLIVLVGSFGVFYSGSTIVSDSFREKPQIQVKILEAQYSLTKKHKVLENLCSVLQTVGGDESKEYYEKFVSYSEIYLSESDDFDRILYSQYIIALSRLSRTERVKEESRKFLNKCVSDDDFECLYHALFVIKQQGSQEEKDYVKSLAREILDGSYLKSDIEEKYNELKSKYMLLAE